MSRTTRRPGFALAAGLLALLYVALTPSPILDAQAQLPLPSPVAFGRGDLFLTFENGDVQWRLSDGTLNRTLVSREVGTGEGVAFDTMGSLYVSRWCLGDECRGGNLVERFNSVGIGQGTYGSGYDCSPHGIVFDSADTAYVGLAGCSGAILKFVGGELQAAFPVAPDTQGAFWIDLAPDLCTMFYTSYGPNVKRYDVCANVQLTDFNAAPLPGLPLPGRGAHDVRVLPDGGVLVASDEVIARLNSTGQLVRTYAVTGEANLWTGLGLVGDGTFWAVNYEASTVHRFDIDSGSRLASFGTGTPSHTIVAVTVKR